MNFRIQEHAYIVAHSQYLLVMAHTHIPWDFALVRSNFSRYVFAGNAIIFMASTLNFISLFSINKKETA